MGRLHNTNQFRPTAFVETAKKCTAEDTFFDAINKKYPDYAKNLTERFQEATGEEMNWSSINLPNLYCFVQYLKFEGLGDKSVNQYAHKVMAVLNLYRGLHPEVPSKEELSSVLNPELDESYDVTPTDDEVDMLYSYLAKLLNSPHEREKHSRVDRIQYKIEVLSHYLVSCDTGARSFDEKGLSWKNVTETKDSEGNSIYVLTYTTNKRGIKASVPIAKDSRLVPLLKNLMPLTVCHRECNRWIKVICKEAGLTREIKRRRAGKDIVEPLYNAIHFHIGRKTYCTINLRRGVPITEVMMSMGHTNPKQTLSYNCGTPLFSSSNVSSQRKETKGNSVF